MSWRGLVFSFGKKGVSIQRVNGTDLKYYDYIIPKSPITKAAKESEVRLSHLYRHYFLVVKYINHFHKHALNEHTTKKLAFYDKLFQHFLLSTHDVPVVPSLLYTGKQTPKSVYDKFKKPYIIKSIEGLGGKQVFLITQRKAARKLLEKFGLGQLLVQKYVPITQDYRVLVLGNKAIGAMKRVAPGSDFRTNISIGGKAEKSSMSKEMQEVAVKATKVFNAEFAGVDIIKHKGIYYVLEVNIFPGFEGFEQATGINVARELVMYIEKKYLWSVESEFAKEDKKSIFENLYKIEKENLEKPLLTPKKFLKTVLERELVVINKERKPIAYLTHYKKDDVRRITRYGILPKYRGQRMGRRMLRALIKISKTERDLKINAVIPLSNKKRQTTFKRAGFKKTDTILKDHFGESGDGVVYEYIINPEKRVKGPGLTKQKGRNRKK